MKFEKIINELIKKEIDSATRKMYESMCCNELVSSTSTSSTYTTASLSLESFKNMIEKLRPQYAILLNNYIEDNQIFEMENILPDKYYCKKLLLINHNYYHIKLKNIMNQYGCNIKVYE
jgi:hypothetical protein